MHDIEPWYGWRDYYIAEEDKNHRFIKDNMMNSFLQIKYTIILFILNGIFRIRNFIYQNTIC